MNDWIPVSERLPADATPVLASNGTDVSLCVYKESQKWWRHVDDYYYWTPTHWMPLPPAPPEVK